MPRGDRCCKGWAIELRKQMYRDKFPEITSTIDEIAQGAGDELKPTEIRSRGFWNACRDGKKDFDTIIKQGLEIDFEPTPAGTVESVTFRLNEKWLAHFHRVRSQESSKISSS